MCANDKKNGTSSSDNARPDPSSSEPEDVLEQNAELEKQLRQSQKMEAVGQLAGGIAHDFNNLLMVILNSAQFVRDDLPDNASTRGDVENIINAAKKAAVLTRQLLAFSRRQTLIPEPVDINQIARGVEKMLSRLIGEDVELIINVTDTPCMARVDPGQIEQVILNLAVNARDAMPHGGRLIIETRHAGPAGDDRRHFIEAEAVSNRPYVMFSVSDTGTGMDHDTQSHIFEPFFTTKEMGRGTGLGLSTVYGIIRQHGGHIAVYSELKLGTTFKVYLPELLVEGADRETEQREIILPRGSETILLAEDDPHVRRVAVRMLKGLGYTVIESDSGEAAIQIAAKTDKHLDLLLTDIVMPGMNGKELAAKIRKAKPDIKVLYASGYPEAHLERNGILDVGDKLLHKPFIISEVATRLRETLDQT